MQTGAPDQSATMTWSGRILSGVVILFLLMDIVVKLLNLPVAGETMAPLGWSPEVVRPLGVLLAICTALYAYPRTALLGAVLLTGYLGGAIATHWRVGSPLFTHILFGVYLGLFVWAGLWLRDAGFRQYFPLRSTGTV
jgi:hypothetical protein